MELTQTEKRSVWCEYWLWLAVALAFSLRVVFFTAGASEPGGLSRWYIRSAATLASGHGLLMRTKTASKNEKEFSNHISVTEFMKQRQAEGGQVDPEHPFPESTFGWLPATLRPPGYSYLLYIFYRIGNYDGMIILMYLLQALLDASVCLLIFLFARNVFERQVGLWSAWSYAVLPPAILVSARLLPSSLNCFFMALVLCLASCARIGRSWMLLAAGAAIGLSVYFRSEFLLLPVPVFLALWAWRGRFWVTFGWFAGLICAVLMVLTPWVLWTRSTTGKAMLTTTSTGATMYQALGEVPNNPWNVFTHDPWIDQDAIERGFMDAWTVRADTFYRKLFVKCVKEHPGFYAKLVLFHRLPLAVAAPYIVRDKKARDEFSFTDMRKKEQLSRWQVVRKYPTKVLRHMWKECIMLAISGFLTLTLIYVTIVGRRQWRRFAWVLLPWLYVVGSISMVKQIEPRNVSAGLVLQTVALGIAIITVLHRRQKDAGCVQNNPTPT